MKLHTKYECRQLASVVLRNHAAEWAQAWSDLYDGIYVDPKDHIRILNFAGHVYSDELNRRGFRGYWGEKEYVW